MAKKARQARQAEELAADLARWLEDLQAEPDRGCVLISAAFLEEATERLIRSRLVDDEAMVGDMFRGMGPLATFSVKIRMAYLLGLISKQQREDLDRIREIRNDFAHSHRRITLDDAGIADRCNAFHNTGVFRQVNPRSHFIGAVALLCNWLLIGAMQGKNPTVMPEPRQHRISL